MQQLNTRHLATLSLVAPGIGLSLLLTSSPASGATYEVGRGKPYASLEAVAPRLAAGDVVEVQGDATYSGDIIFKKSGTASKKITIRGIRVNGRRPVLSGGTNTVVFAGNHYVFEGFDITRGTNRCVFNRAHDITIRDTVVHHCPGHGILGADSGSGSLTLEYVEVYASGKGDTRHPIYIATDEETYPGSVFRMLHSYVHDGNGGNNVKSRAERNEIYYNWIEGAKYHEIELIGPDGQAEGLAREDSDVVGNVFRKTGKHFVARIGGDGTGQTFGRFRFVNNTFLLAPGSNSAIRMFDGIESVEMSNNVFYRVGGGGVDVYVDRSAKWATGKALISGLNNWVSEGSTAIPASWRGTVHGTDPGFTNLGALDLRPSARSPLVNAGARWTASPSGYPFPRPLAAPRFVPVRGLCAPGSAPQRPAAGVIDIGAYEHGTGVARRALAFAEDVGAWADRDGAESASDDVESAGDDVWGAGDDVGDAGDDVGETWCATEDDVDGDDAEVPARAPEVASGNNEDVPSSRSAGSCSFGGGALAGGPFAGTGAALAAAATLLGAALRRRSARPKG